MTDTESSAIPSREQYEQSELRLAYRHIADVANAPLADRKEAQKTYAKALLDPAWLQERCEWLLNGDYGYGPMVMARRIAKNQRQNQTAALGQLIACFEWQCDERSARQAWKKLTKAQQVAANAAIQKAIDWNNEQED